MLIMMGGTTREKNTSLSNVGYWVKQKTSGVTCFSSRDPNGYVSNSFTVKSYTKWLFQSKARGSPEIEKDELLNSSELLSSQLIDI